MNGKSERKKIEEEEEDEITTRKKWRKHKTRKDVLRTPWCSEKWMNEWRQVLKALASYGRWRRW